MLCVIWHASACIAELAAEARCTGASAERQRTVRTFRVALPCMMFHGVAWWFMAFACYCMALRRTPGGARLRVALPLDDPVEELAATRQVRHLPRKRNAVAPMT